MKSTLHQELSTSRIFYVYSFISPWDGGLDYSFADVGLNIRMRYDIFIPDGWGLVPDETDGIALKNTLGIKRLTARETVIAAKKNKYGFGIKDAG